MYWKVLLKRTPLKKDVAMSYEGGFFIIKAH